MLQFVTDINSKVSVTDQVKAALDAGCRWITVKMDGASDDEITKVVEVIKPWCLDKGSFLLLEGHVELAKILDVGGVHLTKTDMLPSKARLALGPAAVIGVEAHNFDDVKAVRSLDVDYITVGPYATEDGKDALGLEGLMEIFNDMQKEEINIAHVAFGGIRAEDIDALMNIGANGVAVSRAIADVDDIKAATEDILKLLEPYEKAEEEKE